MSPGAAPDAPAVQAVVSRFGAEAGEPAAVVAGADLVVIATPDDAIDAVAADIAGAVDPDTLVIHLSGARGVDALTAVPARTGALHPLQSLPDPEIGATRLAGSYAAVAGDAEVEALATAMGMIPFRIADARPRRRITPPRASPATTWSRCSPRSRRARTSPPRRSSR